jgi:hypothetical protein
MLRSRAASVRFAEVVGHDGLGVENTAGAYQIKCARVVEHPGTRRSGPIGLPETICKPPHELIRRRGITPLALNVQ